MFIHLDSTRFDHHRFVWTIEKIANLIISEYLPDDIYIVKMKNGFDFKWLEFSAVTNFQLGEWRDHLTIPPFNPNRVLSQNSYLKDEYNQYGKTEGSPLHVVQNGSQDLKKRISSLTDSGIFVWWSGNTVFKKKGCVLTYIRHNKQSFAWYASFWNGDTWELYKTIGLNRSEIEKYLNDIE